MNITVLTEAEAQHLEQNRNTHGYLSEWCRQNKRNPDSVRSALYRRRSGIGVMQNRPTASTIDSILDTLPANVDVVQKPLMLDWSAYAYATDFHAPLHDRMMTAKLIGVSRELNIRKLLIGGDLLDFSSVSTKHPHDLPQVGVDDTLRVAGDLLGCLLDNFDEVVVLQGNHDVRLSRKLDEKVSFERVLHAALNGRQYQGKLTVTDLSWVYIGDHTVAGHPTGFSKTSSALQKVAAREKRNVLGAHTHLLHLAMSEDGTRWTISPGMMCRPDLTPYLMQNAGLSTFANQSAGFVTVQDGTRPTLFSDLLTSWDTYGIV